jgi:hypothetical protein
MSRIYRVSNRKTGGEVRYVRANTLNGAVRAHAAELFVAVPATTDEIYQASKAGEFKVLDAIKPEQVDIEDKDDPGPVPLRAVT